MEFNHETLVFISKSYGLFYLIGFSILVLIYAFWPSNQKKFNAAAQSILEDEDRPCL